MVEGRKPLTVDQKMLIVSRMDTLKARIAECIADGEEINELMSVLHKYDGGMNVVLQDLQRAHGSSSNPLGMTHGVNLVAGYVMVDA